MYKNIVTLVSILSMLLFSCNENIDDLPYSPYEDENFELITITNFTYDGWTLVANFEANVKRIHSVVVFKNDSQIAIIRDVNQNSFVTSNFASNTTTCFSLAFIDSQENISRKGNTICVD